MQSAKFVWKDFNQDFAHVEKQKVLTGFEVAADDTMGLIQEHIQGGPKSGRVYHKKNPERVHRASAPGEYPATDLGTLVASYGVERDDDSVYLITTAKHGALLEFRKGSGQRDHISRGVLENQDRIIHIVTTVAKAK